ncbi:hypothetical protein H8M03_04450 [Sphingomonas sabuli]|uniref:Protein TonB n=1 Tax=Sphingomonas sabuli TaxID=2764186 RepID=A0A7G9L4N5_9SPHN|nr:hypothetical protein [Sphingomonas sabuli]QNM83584.1 hypothetical protein H8M03_04450 [Sphingomonas sabuli]
MPAYRTPSSHERPPRSRRATGLALALGINLLLLLALLRLGAIPLPGAPAVNPLVIDFINAPAPAPAPAPARRAMPSPAAPAAAEPRPVAPRPRIALPARPSPSRQRPVDVLYLSKDELAAADIGAMAKSAGSGAASDSEELGRAPNGELLYAAEWAREPTAAELGGYLPKNAQPGTGLVACRTIPGNRVEDCIEIESRPASSQLARAVRQAAWQFRVRPPRKNGKELVGSWVRIRIDYLR